MGPCLWLAIQEASGFALRFSVAISESWLNALSKDEMLKKKNTRFVCDLRESHSLFGVCARPGGGLVH